MNDDMKEALFQMYSNLSRAEERQLERGIHDQGLRSQVTSGKHMDCVLDVIREDLISLGYNEKEVYYKTEGRVRKTWNVILEYDVPRFGEKEYKKSDFFKRYYTYYVDATTGEIIGGRVWKP